MGLFDGLRQTWRELTEGLAVRDAPGAFRRDTIKAYGVLGRDHLDRPEPAGFAGRWWFRIRVLFLGLSSKLSPPRRLLFLVCIALALRGLLVLPGDGVGPLAGRTPLVRAVAGLKAGDRVILEGLQRARPGTPVKAVPFAGAANGSPAVAPQAAAGSK